MREARINLFRKDRLETRFASPRWRESREAVPLASLLDEVRAVDQGRCDRLIFAGGGPLDHPQFDALMEEVGKIGFHCLALETEASALADAPVVDSLIARGFEEFFVFVGGATPRVHERVMASPGSFERTIAGLRNLAAARCRVYPVIPLTKSNAPEVEALTTNLIELGGFGFRGIHLAPAETSRVPPPMHAEVLSPREVAHAAKGVFRICDENRLSFAFSNQRGLQPCAAFEELEGYEAVFNDWLQAIGHRKDATQRVEACATCSVATKCPGVERTTVERFGASEFVPVPAAVSERWSRKPAPKRLDPTQYLGDYARDGYVTIRNAIPKPLLTSVQRAFDRLMDPIIAAKPEMMLHSSKNIIERDPTFLELIDLPTTYPLARAIIGADITLVHGGLTYSKRANSPSYLSWHNDFGWMVDVPYPRPDWWVRYLFFVDDIDENTSPMAVVPGSHRAQAACPKDLTGEDGQPKLVPEMVRITGKAGDCAAFNPEIWHTNTDNTTDRPRKLIMLTYKHAWMRQWADGHDISRDFAEGQRDPLRWQLCGGGVWHRQHGLWQA